jgi:outer membrane protein TolC
MLCRVHRPLLVTLASAVLASGCAIAPNPLTEAEIELKAQDSLDRVAAEQEPVRGPIDLYEAMARALKYNLDHRVEAMEAALRIKELDLSQFNMLPNVVASSGYAARDNYNAATSINVLTGAESLAMSTSQEKQIVTADVTFSWNVLDFGLSYVRARQAADKYLIRSRSRPTSPACRPGSATIRSRTSSQAPRPSTTPDRWPFRFPSTTATAARSLPP